MDSPLKYDEAIVKELNIKNDLEDVEKLAFARAMLDEMKKVTWRNRMDLLASQFQADMAPDETLKEAHKQKVSGYRNDVKQMAKTVDIYTKLVHELEAKVGTTE